MSWFSMICLQSTGSTGRSHSSHDPGAVENWRLHDILHRSRRSGRRNLRMHWRVNVQSKHSDQQENRPPLFGVGHSAQLHREGVECQFLSDVVSRLTNFAPESRGSFGILFFRMEKYLEEIFKHLHVTCRGLESRLKAEGFKARVLQVLKAWDEWLVYHREFILKLKTIFLGIQNVCSVRFG